MTSGAPRGLAPSRRVGKHAGVSSKKSPSEQALDLFVYAPIGLAVTARELIPQLIEKGRTRVNGQVTMAKMVGQFAVQQGQVEVQKRVDAAKDQATGIVGGLLGGRDGSAPTPGTTAAPTAPRSAAAPAGPTATPAEAATLAIPDYDSLSASQVVPRLVGLSGGELDDVRQYEAKHRARKTILNRIDQLQAG